MNNLKPCLGTCSWEPCWQPIAWNLPREFVLGTRTCSWEPVLRTLACEPVLAKLACKPVLGEPCLGTCSWKPCLGTCSQGPCRYPARKPVLGTLAWELEALFLEPLLVNLFLRTLLGNLGNVGNLGNLGNPGNLGEPWEPWGNGFWSCSGLLRNLYYGWRPQSFCCWGKTCWIPRRVFKDTSSISSGWRIPGKEDFRFLWFFCPQHKSRRVFSEMGKIEINPTDCWSRRGLQRKDLQYAPKGSKRIF